MLIVDVLTQQSMFHVLVLLPWSPAAGGYVDDHERAAELPVADGRRAITRIERRGVPVSEGAFGSGLRGIADRAAAVGGSM